MSVKYWDYTDDISGYWHDSGNTTISSGDYWPDRIYWTNTTSSSADMVLRVIRILVKNPKHWTKQDAADFVYLINKGTNTGFKVEMVIDGNIEITDPSIEKRSMKNFLPLLLSVANAKDAEIIRDFFEKHPLEKQE